MAVEKVTLSGSSTVLPLGEAIAEAFNIQQRDYLVSVTGGGTGAGITGISEGRSNIAMASREITADEMSKYGNKFQEFLVGYDGIVLVVSKPLYEAGITGLTKNQVKDIYSGKIKSWKELGGPDQEIYVIAREQGSGTRDTFNEDIIGDKKIETPGIDTVALGSAEVKTAVAGSDKAIGYLGFSYVEGGNIEPIALEDIFPTEENIRDGVYELSRKLYFYTYGEPTPGSKDFINFAMSSEGQMIAQENGFIPLATVDIPEKVEDAGHPAKEAPVSEKSPGFESVAAILGLLSIACLCLGRKG